MSPPREYAAPSMARPTEVLRSLLVGRPKATAGLEHERLTKRVALAVFASDALSSSAYATQEMLVVLITAGTASLAYSVPLAMAITTVLGIVIFSYRQTIYAYPDGASAYIVASTNLGKYPGLVAASALLIDYVLTVAVSITAGVDAIVSLFPELHSYKVLMAIAVIFVITMLNLRGVKEAGAIFAVPTYAYIVLIGSLVIVGLLRYAQGFRVDAHTPSTAAHGVTLFLLLRAYSHGSTALTGVEAVSDGVQAFRKPVARNAAVTLVVMGVLLGFLFVGLTVLAHLYHITGPSEHPHRTVVALIALTVFGQGPLFIAIQMATFLILFLAANTSYSDFPRLANFLARDRYAPRQFMNRGDRLAFSNGIVVLGALAAILVAIYGADLNRIINLYVVGVFTSFTLSQAGMVRHWLKTKDRGWRRSMAINAFGALVTALVLVVVATVKFVHGAWIVIVAIPILVAGMMAMRRHYASVAVRLKDIAGAARPRPNRIILLASHTDAATERALQYAASIDPESITVVHAVEREANDDLMHTWGRLYPQYPLVLLDPDRNPIARRIRRFIRLERDQHPQARITVLLSERFRRRGLLSVFTHRHSLILKTLLLFEPEVAVTDLTVLQRRRMSQPDHGSILRHLAVVAVSEATRPTLEALEYTRSLHPSELRCVHVNVDDRQRDRVVAAWQRGGLTPDLRVIESPYRSVVRPLLRYIRRCRRDEPEGTLINVVLPEFIVPGKFTQLLHNQTGLVIKAILAVEPWVAVTSVPFHLGAAPQRTATEPRYQVV